MRRRTFFMLMCYVRGFACTWMALRARNPSPSGLATLNPQSTCHGPRPGPKLACGVRAGSLRATEPRARGKTLGRKRKRCRRDIYIYVQRSSSVCVWRDIPGVTQVDEKGHEGSTAVVTAYNIYIGWNMVKETTRQEEFLLTTIIHFEHYFSSEASF